MSNMAQHQVAELWEIARDHHVIGAKLQWFSQQVQDSQLRSTLEQHARRYQQIGQQVEGFLRQDGATTGATAGFQSFQQTTGGFATSGTFAQGSTYQGTQTGTQPIDVLAAGECLKDCKCMAVNSVVAAAEASQPFRNFLYQIAGEHLQMADQHYHWLEQRGLYAAPKADQQTMQQYSQALRQIAQAGQHIAGRQTVGQTQGYGQFQQTAQTQPFAGQYQYAGQSSPQYGQQHGQYQTQNLSQQPSFTGAQSYGGQQSRD